MKNSKSNLLIAVVLSLISISVFGQDVPYKAPLYWSTYEANILRDAPIEQDEWLANVEWINEEFKEYGYDMIATDGWIEYSTETNEHGYVTKYNDEWTMTWHDMGDHLEQRGLELGVYYNPFWITPKAANDPSKTVKGRPDIKVGDLVDREYQFPQGCGSFLPGDRFGYMFCRSNDVTLYWVQADADGAEEYVKGYVEHFAEAGATYFRVDFLSWYEDGMDKGSLAGKPNRPKEHYIRMLKWIREACDEHGIFLSLVMPHLNNEGELEKQYGHMIRINEDAGKNGGWGRWSELDRGNRRPYWSQWANAVDGFTYWSKLSGRGKLILDGDFLRMNTFGDDNERKSVISLSLMAGGPVTISDRVNSIGEHAWLYQNEEMLELNYDGFVGKPLTNDPSQPEAYIWKGQMSNGDWVVGLFNRDDNPKTMSINFADLGIEESEVRDLWEHTDLGKMTSYSSEIPPRGCVVLKLIPDPCELNQQTISFEPISDKDAFDDPFTIDASANSGLPISFEITGPATLNGDTVTLTQANGTVIITANQPGNNEYCAAPSVSQSFEVIGGIVHEDEMYVGATFNDWSPGSLEMELEDHVWVAKDVQISAGDHELKFANSPDWTGDDWGDAEGLSGTARLTTGGEPNIRFNIPSSGSFDITFNDQTLDYSIANGGQCTSQSISFETIPDKTVDDEPFTINASATSGLPVKFSLISGPASLNGNTITLNGAPGIVTIEANQPGDDTYCAAPVVTRAFNVTDPGGENNPFKAPLYWSVYEHHWIKDQQGVEDNYIPESVLMENVDMVDQHLKDYGYDMICIDGWGDDQSFNEHGYRTKHSSNWQHDYAWWANELQSRGMNLGMYNNPLWVNMTAVDAGVTINGTDIPLSNIVDENEDALWFTWVQVDQEGAEEYVKGYIDYYANMGIKYLRVDFLSWFEDGHDQNLGRVGPNRPKEHYETALRWMREACDENDMLLSLVMPHLKNEAELEKQYGHMIRINDDVWDGGWNRFSEFERGNRSVDEWSQWNNAFDGYIYWSKIAGRGKMILDGDFIRLNTMANITEKISVISLHLMAGGPLTPTDQEGSSMTQENIDLYTNEEMLALNEDGFVGKPLTNDPTDESSQIWTGQMSNGDWIIGLFNREGNTRTRSINFADLDGFTAESGQVRDLWKHEDLGSMSSFSAEIPAHGCIVLKVIPGGCTGQQQTITFSSIPDKDIDDPPFIVEAEASSGLPVSYSITGPATMNNDTVTLEGINGTVTITASQAGDATYCPAPSVSQSFEVTGGANHQDQMFIGATFNSWTPANLEMTLEGNVWIAKGVQISAGDHELKFANTPDWTGDDWGDSEGLSGSARLTTGGDPNIRFSIPSTSTFTIMFDDQSLAYSIESDSGGNGSDIIIGATYKITARHSGKALDVSEVSNNNGAVVHQWEYIGGDNQKWSVEDAGSGLYKLIAVHSNKTLDIFEQSMDNGAHAHQWDPLNVESQRWSIDSIADGYYTITNSNSGKVLEVSGNSQDNGAVVQQWSSTGADNQQWMFEMLSSPGGRNASNVSDRSEEHLQDIKVQVYPNPVDDQLTIKLSDKFDKVHLVNSLGIKVYNGNVSGNRITIDTSTLTDGVYFLRVMQTERPHILHKIVVGH